MSYVTNVSLIRKREKLRGMVHIYSCIFIIHIYYIPVCILYYICWIRLTIIKTKIEKKKKKSWINRSLRSNICGIKLRKGCSPIFDWHCHSWSYMGSGCRKWERNGPVGQDHEQGRWNKCEQLWQPSRGLPHEEG